MLHSFALYSTYSLGILPLKLQARLYAGSEYCHKKTQKIAKNIGQKPLNKHGPHIDALCRGVMRFFCVFS